MVTDQYGNALKKPDRRTLTQEIAAPTTTGVRRHALDHPSVGLTPGTLAGLLRGAETQNPEAYFKLAEDMEEKDTQYLTVLGTRKRAVCQLDIEVIPGGDSADDVANAALVQEWLNCDTLENELFDIMDAIGKGISLTEIIWDTSENQWMPGRLELVHPTFLEFDPIDLKTPLLKSEGGPMPLPPYKFVYTQLKAKSGIPLRGGLARPVAWAYLFKNYDVKGWVQFMEVYGQPLRIGKYGAGATEEEKRILLRAVRDIGADAAAVIPAGMEVDFITDSGSKGGDGHKALAEYMDHQISKVVLGQSTTTDAISGGHAVSKEHNEVREDIERADAKALAAAINQQILRPLIDLNRGPQKVYPKVRIGRPEAVDIRELTTAVKTLSPLMTFSKKEIYSKIGLSPPDDETDAIGGPGKPAQLQEDDPPTSSPATATRRALAASHGHESDAVDQLVDDALDGTWEEILDPVLEPVRDLVQNAGSFEEVKELLAGRLEDMDDEALQELLARSGFNTRAAAIGGAIGEEEDE